MNMEAIYPIKAAIPAYGAGRNGFKFRSVFSLSVSCSQENLAQSSRRNEEFPVVQSDWRAFRAGLVNAERTLTVAPQKPGLVSGLIEGKWVHTIPEPEKGCLLIATEKLDGNHIYKRTVILVLSSTKTGITGLILNRPSFMSSPVLESPLFFGGPLYETLFLVNGEKPSGVYDEVIQGLYYGSMESLDFEEAFNGNRAFRIFDGYCSWEEDELRNEIRAGYWTLTACSPNLIGLNIENHIGLWDEINALMGRRKVC